MWLHKFCFKPRNDTFSLKKKIYKLIHVGILLLLPQNSPIIQSQNVPIKILQFDFFLSFLTASIQLTLFNPFQMMSLCFHLCRVGRGTMRHPTFIIFFPQSVISVDSSSGPVEGVLKLDGYQIFFLRKLWYRLALGLRSLRH